MKSGKIAVMVYSIGIILSVYIGGWLLFIKPIIACCIAFDTGTLTAMMVGIAFIKIIFATGAVILIMAVADFIASLIMGN